MSQTAAPGQLSPIVDEILALIPDSRHGEAVDLIARLIIAHVGLLIPAGMAVQLSPDHLTLAEQMTHCGPLTGPVFLGPLRRLI